MQQEKYGRNVNIHHHACSDSPIRITGINSNHLPLLKANGFFLRPIKIILKILFCADYVPEFSSLFIHSIR